MASNIDIQDDWRWFPEYKGVPIEGDEFIIVSDGKCYRATRDQVRRAVGLGWVWYVDSEHTTSARQLITAGTRTLITINKLGADTEIRFRDGIPAATYENNTLFPQAVGETYELRLQFKISPAASSGGEFIVTDLDIGDGSLVLIYESTKTIAKGQGVTDLVTLTIPIFCLETFFANGGKFYVTPSVGMDLWDKAIFIQRVSQP